MEDSTFKIIFAGNQGVGKTSLLCRFVEGTFQDNIGEFEVKKRAVTVDGEEYALAFFDTAGQERFRTLTSGYYTNMNAAVMVYDVSDEQSYIDLPNWVGDVKRYGRDAVMMILANKTDLGNGKIDLEEAQSYAEANQCKFFAVSAKDGSKIDDAFQALVEAVVEKKKAQVAADEPPPAPEKSGCCTLL